MLAQRPRPITSAPGDGSRTITIHDVPTPEDNEGRVGPSNPRPVLKLRGGPRSKQRVAWKEEVIDNEGFGRKKSKICCIYHKPKKFDESSDESSSSDESDDGRARLSRNTNRRGHSHPHNHDHPHEDGGVACAPSTSEGTVVEEEPPRPNAYDVQPKPSGKGKGKSS